MDNSDNKVLRLNNFEDFGPSRLRLLKYIENGCLEYLISAGYSNVDPPILESADLFLKKSLGSTSSSTYTFMDSENQLAMNLGETYLVTEKGNERLGKQKLDLVVL